MRELRDGRLLTLLGCAAVVGFGLATCGTENGSESFDERRDSIAAAVAIRLHRQADSLARVYRTDTVRLTRTRWRTDTLLAGRDTLLHRDTVRVYVEAERKACDAVIATCEARLAVSESLRRNDSTALAAYRTAHTGGTWRKRLQRVKDVTVGAAAGYLLGKLTP